MRLVNLKILVKLKKKNIGNIQLVKAIDKLIDDLQENSFTTFEELRRIRTDADKAHPDGFYFFDLHLHRTMVMIELEDGEGTVVWAGTHDDYESIFKNNKNTIEKWLRDKGYIV